MALHTGYICGSQWRRDGWWLGVPDHYRTVLWHDGRTCTNRLLHLRYRVMLCLVTQLVDDEGKPHPDAASRNTEYHLL